MTEKIEILQQSQVYELELKEKLAAEKSKLIKAARQNAQTRLQEENKALTEKIALETEAEQQRFEEEKATAETRITKQITFLAKIYETHKNAAREKWKEEIVKYGNR